MKHGYGNIVQLNFMALLSKNPVLASLFQYFNSRSDVPHCEISDEICSSQVK